jgi:hypothetical protein
MMCHPDLHKRHPDDFTMSEHAMRTQTDDGLIRLVLDTIETMKQEQATNDSKNNTDTLRFARRANKESDALRLIYARGQRVGPDPVGYYVYLWRHGDIDRYVGRGANGRYAAHAKPDRNDVNQRKYRYFLENLPEMTCFVIAEGLASEKAAGELEIAEIDQRGFEVDGTGTLLNMRRGSVVNGPRGKRDIRSMSRQYQLWVKLKKLGHFTPNALLWRAGRALTGNPKRPNSSGAAYLNHYPPPGETTTVGELLAKGRADGFKDKDQLAHLAWDVAHGFIELALPDGETVVPGHILPTRELLDRLAQMDD